MAAGGANADDLPGLLRHGSLRRHQGDAAGWGRREPGGRAVSLAPGLKFLENLEVPKMGKIEEDEAL